MSIRYISYEEAMELERKWRENPPETPEYVRSPDAKRCPICGDYEGESWGTGDCNCEPNEPDGPGW